MANIKDYSLSGVSNSVQYGKNGGNVFFQEGRFKLKLTEEQFSDIDTGTLYVNQGNIVFNDADGQITFDGASLKLNQNGVPEFEGSALIIPAGANADRPAVSVLGMVRLNTETNPVFEYFNGVSWVSIGALSTASGSPIVITNVGGTVELTLNTVPVPYGGTGKESLTEYQILFGMGVEPVGQTSGLVYNQPSETLKIGSNSPIEIDGNLSTIKVAGENSDLTLLPNGTGAVVVGGTGNSTLQSGEGETLTLKATNSQLILDSAESINIVLPTSDSTKKISVVGPSDVEYSQGLGSNDLVNKYYVDNLFGIINGGGF